MKQRALRTVLLAHAIEDTDRAGEALAMADRAHATREAAEGAPPPTPGSTPAAPSEGFLVRRAQALILRLRVRSPGIDRVLAVADGAPDVDRTTLLLAFGVGVALSFAEGGRIDIFAYPLIALVVWNVLVCLVWVGRLFSAREPGSRLRDGFGRLYARRVRARLDALIAHSSGFNAPLAPGLRRFAAQWSEIGWPLFRLRARRLLHLAAVLVAVGLMAGYEFRGRFLGEPAGWNTTVFGPSSAHTALVALYGPASAVSGVALPSAEQIRSLLWTGPASGGAAAGEWLYLIDWTALLYIVFPRLLAALVSTVSLWRESSRLAPPAALSTDSAQASGPPPSSRSSSASSGPPPPPATPG